VYVVIRQLLLLRDEFRIPKLTFHSDLLHSTLEKIPLFTPKLCGLDIGPDPQIARSVRSAAAPARPMGAAACVYNAHIESPSDTPSLPVSHQCAALPANHRSLYGCRPTAIAATGISATEIHFALGIAAPGGLTSGFALPI